MTPLRLEYRTRAELHGNPGNWRTHSEMQRTAMREAFDTVGWAGAVLFNERTGRLIDGHMRVDAAGDEEQIPTLVGDWSEDEERFILATFDPLGDMAEHDAARLDELLDGMVGGGDAIAYMLDQLTGASREVETTGAQTGQLPQALQLQPAREYVVIMCADDDGAEFERLRELLGLGLVRRGGYTKGSSFDVVGVERVVKAERVIELLDVIAEPL